MAATIKQPDAARPRTETEGPPEPPDADELDAKTCVVIKIERTRPMEAWVIAQEFGCGFARGKPCDRHRD